MSLHTLIELTGVLAFICLLMSMLSGILFFKYHVKWMSLKWHIIFAVLTVIFATAHVTIIIFAGH